MPVVVRKGGDKWRVVERDTGKVANGGTHSTKAQAMRHAAAINMAHARKRGYDVPKAKS